MASAMVTINMLDMPYVQRVLFAAFDLAQEIEDGDKALLPDRVVEAAERFRVVIGKGPDS